MATYTVQYRVTSLGGGWTQVTGISGTSATITGLTASTRYDFQVAAVTPAAPALHRDCQRHARRPPPSTTAVVEHLSDDARPWSTGNIYNLRHHRGTDADQRGDGLFDRARACRAEPDASARGWLVEQFQRQLLGHLCHRAERRRGRITAGPWATRPDTPCSPSSARRSPFPDVTILFIAPGRSLGLGGGKHAALSADWDCGGAALRRHDTGRHRRTGRMVGCQQLCRDRDRRAASRHQVGTLRPAA